MNNKIQNHHLKKPAYIYIRQSTLGQVLHHRESTERQYAFRQRALEMGWTPQSLVTLDGNLGQSGAQTATRNDFQTLLSEVAAGRVGGIFALEASRLARSCLDWQHLIRICALTDTLVVDEDGCYNPADFNDSLLLGLKGTIAQAELHFIRARLLGGKLNKAKKGELRFPLPVGFCYDEMNRIVFDPDQQVREMVGLVFESFRRLGTAYAVVLYFAEKDLSFPKRAYGGAWEGKLCWGRLAHSRVLTLLKNPVYAGTYVYGRFRGIKQVDSQGTISTRTKMMPQKDWQVMLSQHHQGYISWETYMENQKRLVRNRTHIPETVTPAHAREGLALLQGLLICRTCGHRILVRYTGNGGVYPTYQCNWRKREGLSRSHCIHFKSDFVDQAVCRRVLEVFRPEQLDLAVGALQELERRDGALLNQWKMRLQRADYEAQLAQRRYEEVDPANRLVAASLESRWNDALTNLQQLRQQHDTFVKKEARATTPEQKQKVLSLAKDFPRLWNAPTTAAKDKKRMLRLIIKDITVEAQKRTRRLVLHLRWQGGASEDLVLDRPKPYPERLRYSQSIIDQVGRLVADLDDGEIANQFNQQGLISAKGKPFTAAMIQWIRFKYRIPVPNPKAADEFTVAEVSRQFGISPNVVYYWIERDIVSSRRRNQGSPYWIKVDSQTRETLTQWVLSSSRIPKTEIILKVN